MISASRARSITGGRWCGLPFLLFFLCGCAWVESDVLGTDALLIRDGQFVIQQTARGIKVICVDEQLIDPEKVSFRWWMVPLGGGLFPQDAYERGSSESSLAIGNGESLIPWSGRSPGSGFLYRHSGILDGRRDNKLQFIIVQSENDNHGRMWRALESQKHGVDLSEILDTLTSVNHSEP